MNRLRVSVLGTVLFLVVAVTCGLMTSHQSAAQKPLDTGASVDIASPLPLPVTGTLSVSPGSAVTVNNPSSSPVPVQDVDRGKPFQRAAMSIGGSNLNFGPVPRNERWIIEHASAKVEGGAGLVAFDFFLYSVDPDEADWLIPQQTAPNRFITNSQTKFIVNPGETLHFTVTVNQGVGFTAFISGVIVPAP